MKARILYIEDNPQNLYLISFLLQTAGHTVIQATNGLDGIALAQEHKPDLILLDIQLPHMNGYEIAQRLRAHSELLSVPIVAVTSYAMVGDKEQALAAGCNGYIEKPINPDTFLDQIADFLPNNEGGQP